MKTRLISIVIIVASLLAACSAATPAAQTAPGAPPLEYSNKSFQTSGGAGGSAGSTASDAYNGPTTNTSSSGEAQANRLVIKNANISIYVNDPITVSQRISKMAEEMGGYVVTANVVQVQLSSGVQAPHATVSIRVPVEKLDEAMSRIRAETTLPIITENITSQDVTSEYTDLQSRLRNLEAAESQLQKIMDSATKTEDVLAVYNQLVQTREQIEVIKGQMKYYEQSAALSMINVDLTANAAVQPVSGGGWQPSAVARDALQALVNTLQGLANVIIVFILYVLPLFLILAVVVFVIYLLVRLVLRRKAK